jgi:membrane-bound lytic murein transglycosylase B
VTRIVFPISAALLLFSAGCGPKPEVAKPAEPETPASETVTAAAAEADLGPLLAELTQTVRKYGFEKQKVPASLDELVAAGYLPAKPVAPAGKKFFIDPKTMQVVVVPN